jgi:hypothetical protein
MSLRYLSVILDSFYHDKDAGAVHSGKWAGACDNLSNRGNCLSPDRNTK